jgi:hypothetical protein
MKKLSLNDFYTESKDYILISEQQASRFAKAVCGDFNPIHNPDAKRFCVPGDLLFSLVLAKCGLSRHMIFEFSGMVGRGVKLKITDIDAKTNAAQFDVIDDSGKIYLCVSRDGDCSTNESLTDAFTRSYVAFSGQNFPDPVVPLMAEHKVMFNTQRPLIVYESMSFDLTTLTLTDPVLELSSSKLDVNGKRGDVFLNFNILSSGKIAGTGVKKMVLSGLREYVHEQMQQFVDDIERSKSDFHKYAEV